MILDPLIVPKSYFRRFEKSEIFLDASSPWEVDLGCGDGQFLVQMAAKFPEWNFLGVERLLGRVEKTAARIRRLGLTNARVLRLESSYTVGWLLPLQGVTRLHLLCPDPWPKKKHHGRRLFKDPEFLDGMEAALEIGGEFLLKTDDPPYYEEATEAVDSRTRLERLPWQEDAFDYAKTSFELQWLAIGKPIHRARWRLKQLA